MAYGIEVKNLSGYTQIDGLDKNLQIVATGTTANFPQAPYLTTSLPIGVDNSVVVFISPNTTTGSGQGSTVGVWGYVDYAANTFIIGRNLSFNFYQGSFNYVVCVSNQAEPTSGYGFNTYTSSGDLAFSSAYKQMKGVIHDTYSLSGGGGISFDETNSSWDSGTLPQDYYVMINALGRVGRIQLSGSSWCYRCSFVTWGWANATIGSANRIFGGSGLGLPQFTGTVTNLVSDDTRTQVIARSL
tara:strand:+ start:374 stop:1102 length:729 start_codon:yes stop_codon:yes gene_type:complete